MHIKGEMTNHNIHIMGYFMKQFGIISIAVMLALLLTAAIVWASEQAAFSPVERESVDPAETPAMSDSKGTHNYTGRIRIYVVEKTSRWYNDYYSASPYKFGFLDFAANTQLDIPYLDTYSDTVVYNGSGWGPLDGNNMMVIAAVFNPSPHLEYTEYLGNPFYAFYVDATAAADVDSVWPNNSTYPNFTHTVLVEEATATWCPNCPNTMAALSYLYENEDNPFFYVSMVADVNAKAYSRLDQDYNFDGYPQCFFDGGYDNITGGYSGYNAYRIPIMQSGNRDVHEMDLTVEMSWLGSDQIEIIYTITNNEVVNESPNNPEAPTADVHGVINTPHEFQASTFDPDSDDLYYRFAWSEGDTSSWYGPYASSDDCITTHEFTAEGIYDVTVQAKDSYDALSNWSASGVTVQIHAFMAGDANNDLSVNLLDITFLINYLYNSGQEPTHLGAANADGTGGINLLDITYLINFLYKDGSPPVYP